MKKKNPTHESISASVIGYWAMAATALLVNTRISGQFIKCHLQRSEFENLPERETNPFYVPQKNSLSGRSNGPYILCHYVCCIYKYGDKTFLCTAFHFNYAPQRSILFLCSLRETWVAHIYLQHDTTASPSYACDSFTINTNVYTIFIGR